MIYLLLGSVVCGGVGPICLGLSQLHLKKKKNREKIRERKKRICPDFINKATLFICGPIELKFGREVWNSRSYNLIVEIRFWARELVLLLINSNEVFFLYFLQFFFVSFIKRDCIILWLVRSHYSFFLKFLKTFDTVDSTILGQIWHHMTIWNDMNSFNLLNIVYIKIVSTHLTCSINESCFGLMAQLV